MILIDIFEHLLCSPISYRRAIAIFVVKNHFAKLRPGKYVFVHPSLIH